MICEERGVPSRTAMRDLCATLGTNTYQPACGKGGSLLTIMPLNLYAFNANVSFLDWTFTVAPGGGHTTPIPPGNPNWRVNNANGQKPFPRYSGGSRRRCRGAGRRSSRKGQAGRIREGLQSVWGGLLVRSGNGYVLEDRLLRSCPDVVARQHQ